MHGPYSQIIAIDLGKFNSVVCVYNPADTTHRFQSVATTPRAVHDLLSGLIRTPGDAAKVLVVFETCEVCGWVHDVATGLGFAVAVANPCHEAWRWTKVKRKTDRDDALKLARMAALGQLPTVHVPSPAMRRRRRLVHHRHSLVRRRTRTKDQVRSIFAQQGMPLPPRGKAWTKAGVEQLRAESRPLAGCGEQDLWRGRLAVELALLKSVDEQLAAAEARLDAPGAGDERVRLLTSVPGVGRCLAQTVVCHLDDVRRFKSAGRVGSYAGLVPKQMESGQVKRSGRITRHGPRLLRGMLVEVAWMVYRHNAWAKAFVTRVSRGAKGRKKVAIVARARELLVILWAMLRDNRPWREPAGGDTPVPVAAAHAPPQPA
jgi:transposase